MKFRQGIVYFMLGSVMIACAATLKADEVPGLYEAEVPTETQNRDERDEAIRTALQEVLVRVTGRSSSLVLTVTEIEAALAQPTRYVQQYRYRAAKDDTLSTAASQQQVLWVRFDKRAVDKLLHDNRLPVWGRTRPATLLWLVVDNRRQRILLNTHSEHPAREAVENSAQKRGLPIRLPLMDLTDRSALSTSDVWGNFEDNILRASERYQTEAVLVGRVFQTYSGAWSGRWTLYSEGRRQDWVSSAQTVSEAILPGIDETTDTLAMRFAHVEEGGSDSVLVQIHDVKGLGGYNRALKYLQSLAVVTKVQPRIVKPESVIFDLTSRSGRLGVSRAIALGHTLVAEISAPTPAPDLIVNPVAAAEAKANPEPETAVVDLQFRLVP